MPVKQPKVLNVGQCDLDHPRIHALIADAFGAAVERAHTAAEALARARAERFDLVLINRILDADGSSGLELVRQLKQAAVTPGVPVMLVSNYASAQQAAVALGAEPGFGKDALDDPATVGLLKPYLNPQMAPISQVKSPE
jgi:two-component system chemotaxis response regulator CheY